MSQESDDALRASKDLALRIAAVVAALESCSEAAMASIDESRQVMLGTSSRFGRETSALLQDVSRGVESSVRGCTERALASALPEVHAAIALSARRVEDAAKTLAAERAQLSRQQRGAFWVGSVALVLGSLLLAGASAAWLAMKRKELAQIEFALELHRATEAGALVPCGGRLCARVGEKPRRAGERGEYLVVE